MPPPLCPACQTVLFPTEVEAGWCDSCGKKLPASFAGRLDPKPSQRADPPKRLGFASSTPLWFVLVFGIGLVCWGVEEYRVSLGTSAEPVAIDMAELEKGQELTQNHIRIGPHVRVYRALIYSIRKRDERLRDPSVDFAIYPVVSTNNSFMEKFREQIEAEDLKPIEDLVVPPIQDLRVLVLTKKFRRVSELPLADTPVDSITGLVINRVRGLAKDELDALQGAHPDVDFSRTIILEEDRQPKSLLVALLIGGGGGVLVLVAILGFYQRRRAGAAA